MNIRFKGYVTSNYKVEIEPRNGEFNLSDIQYDIMEAITGDGCDEPEEYTLNRVSIGENGNNLIAEATVKHWFTEDVQGNDYDDAEEYFFNWSDVAGDANRNHKGKPLIVIEEHEVIL